MYQEKISEYLEQVKWIADNLSVDDLAGLSSEIAALKARAGRLFIVWGRRICWECFSCCK